MKTSEIKAGKRYRNANNEIREVLAIYGEQVNSKFDDQNDEDAVICSLSAFTFWAREEVL